MPFVTISKIDAARRQLEVAIRLYFNDGDCVSIHTLVAAAHEVLKDLCNKAKIKGSIKDTEFIRAEKKKEFLGILASAENFFKHADKDPDAFLRFNPKQTDAFLVDSCNLYRLLTGEQTFWIRTFALWATIENPSIFIMDDQQKRAFKSIKSTISSKLNFIELSIVNETKKYP